MDYVIDNYQAIADASQIVPMDAEPGRARPRRSSRRDIGG